MIARGALRAVAVLLLATGCGSGAQPGEADETPSSLGSVIWDEHAILAGDLDTCDAFAVIANPGEDLQVALVDEDRVVVPEVTPPAASDVVITHDWSTSGGCVPTPAGPIIVVEAQEEYADLYDEEPKLVAGFTPEGKQLWVVELAGDLAANYEGRGSILFESLDDNRWLVLDARSGETVASGGLAEGAPVTTLGPTLVDDLERGLVDLSTGRSIGRVGDSTAQVDDDRALLETVDGVRLVRLADLEVIWRAHEDIRLTGIWTAAADLSTSTVVAFDTDGTIVGLDLATGRARWTSDVPRDDVDGLSAQIGSGVVAFRANGSDPFGQVVLDTASGEQLTGAEGYVIADQGLLIDLANGVPTPITVDDLR